MIRKHDNVLQEIKKEKTDRLQSHIHGKKRIHTEPQTYIFPPLAEQQNYKGNDKKKTYA